MELIQRVKTQFITGLQNLRTLVGSDALRKLLVRFRSYGRLLLDILEPRIQIVIVSTTFCVIGLIKPDAAWNGMRDVVVRDMIDSND